MPKNLAQVQNRRKIKGILSELQKIEDELVPGKRQKREDEMKGLTAWQKKKYVAARALNQFREDLEELKNLRNEKPDTRETIALTAKCRRDSKNLSKLLQELNEQWVSDKKKADRKATKKLLKQLQNQYKIHQNLQAQYFGLSLDLQKVPLPDKNKLMKKERERMNKANALMTQTIDNEIQDRSAEPQDRRSRRKERKRKREKKVMEAGGGFGGAGDLQMTVMTTEEEEAREKIAAEYDAQNETLSLIERGLDQVLVIQMDIGAEIKKQTVLIDELNNQMDKVTDDLLDANNRQKKILNHKSAAISGWLCKGSLCLLVLAILGYCYYLFF